MNVLFAHDAVMARTHRILLGEGADQTYVFFGPDFPGKIGYGTFFDLDNPQAAFGTTNISPKPAAMEVATMTRVLDGTTTLGPVKNTPTGVYAYSFQQIGNGKVITALWTHDNSWWLEVNGSFATDLTTNYTLQVNAAGTSGTIQVVDAMGNVSNIPYSTDRSHCVCASSRSTWYPATLPSRRPIRRCRWVTRVCKQRAHASVVSDPCNRSARRTPPPGCSFFICASVRS